MRPAVHASWLPVLLLAGLAAPLAAQPVRMASTAFGETVEIEVRDLNHERARQAIEAAFRKLYEIGQLTDATSDDPGSVGRLNARAVHEPQPVGRELGELLRRSQHFCLWSNGAYGPLGGVLARQIESREATGAGADAGAFRDAVLSARCDRLRVALPGATPPPAEAAAGEPPPAAGDGGPYTVQLAPGSQLDLRGWARGYAVDRALEVLRQAGAGNALIETPKLRRAIGLGPEGKGWLVVLSFPGVEEPVSEIWLRDQALAVATPLARGPADPHYVDQRTGRPAKGVVASVAVSELAVDAEALATTLAIIGLFEGKMRLSALKPPPAALWLLGEGETPPVEAEFRWTELPKHRRR